MFVQTDTRMAKFAVCLSLLVAGGCGAEFGSTNGAGSRPTLDLATVGLDSETTFYESSPNHLFELAEPVPVGSEPRVIRGTIDDEADVDIYDLGAAPEGTRVSVAMAAADTLDPALAAFDETGTTLLVNDHLNVYLGRVDPFLDVVTRHDFGSIYVAISATPGFASAGDYALVVSLESPVTVPARRPDVVLLVFDGGSDVVVGSRLPADVPPFNSGSVSPTYKGMTDLMVAEIVDRVRADFNGFDVVILSTSEGDTFQAGMTRIFFGTFDEALLGVAEGVDEFNATVSQEAMVFTDTFAAFMPLNPTVEEMAQGIANVASHEIGHLLGLVHTADPFGIMDVTATLHELLADQSFDHSPIYGAVFALGFQNAVDYLLEIVGGDPSVVSSDAGTRDPESFKRLPGDQPPARASLQFSSSCNSHRHRASGRKRVDRTFSSSLGFGQAWPINQEE